LFRIRSGADTLIDIPRNQWVFLAFTFRNDSAALMKEEKSMGGE
jgi:hypothetical protein